LFGLESSIYICFVETNFIFNEKYFYLLKKIFLNANNHILNLKIYLVGLFQCINLFKETFSLCTSASSAKCGYPQNMR